MKVTRRWFAAWLLLAAFFAISHRVQAQVRDPSTRSGASVRRDITISELGFADGVHLGSLGGTQTIFFQVPRAAHVASGTLSFAYDEAAPFEGRRSVLVTIGDRTVLTRSLPVGHERQVVEVPLVPEDFAGDFVKMTVRYSGVVTNDRCVDLRLANDRFTVLPNTALRLTLEVNSLDRVTNVLALMPPKVAIGVPERKLSEREFAAVLAAIRLFKARGHQVDVVPLAGLLPRSDAGHSFWERGDVIIAGPSDLKAIVPDVTTVVGSAAKASVAMLADGPGLLMTGDDPQPTINFLGSDWHEASTGDVLRVSAFHPLGRPQARLSFDRLGIAAPISDSPDETVWTANFSAKDIPAGHSPRALDLDFGIGADGSELPAVVNVFLNGRFLTGSTASKHGITRVHAVIPHGLIGLDNQVRIAVRRQTPGGDCTYQPVSFPAQLLGSSAIELGEAESPLQDFFALAPYAREQLSVFVRDDVTVAGQRAALQAIGAVAADLAPVAAPIVVKRVVGERIGTPASVFIAWGDFRFDDGTVPVHIDRGDVLVRSRSGKPLFDLNRAGALLIAQLVTLSNAPSGVWLRAAGEASFAPPTIALDRGNVAFIGPSGVELAMSTEREKLVEVVYPGTTSWLDWLQRYWAWLVGAAWLALTIVILIALQRMRSRRRRDQKEPGQ